LNIELIELKPNERLDIFEMIVEIGHGENGFMNSLYSESVEGFQELITRNYEISRSVNLPEGYVPQTLYWLYINGKPVGYGKLRHFLNDKLKEHGGHIGYVIRPTERGKGFGTIILRELLQEASKKGIDSVLLTCNEDNAASRRIIESNSGELNEISQGVCKYWINLKRTLMVIEIDFFQFKEYMTCSIEIADQIDELREEFLSWLYNEENDHEFWTYHDGVKYGVNYRASAFVYWINNIKYLDEKVSLTADKHETIYKRITF